MSRNLGIELLRRVLRRLLVQRRELQQRAQPGEPQQARNTEQAQLGNARQLRYRSDVQHQRRQQQIRHARRLSTQTSQRHSFSSDRTRIFSWPCSILLIVSSKYAIFLGWVNAVLTSSALSPVALPKTARDFFELSPPYFTLSISFVT